MAMPKSVIRTTKDGFTIVDNVDRCNYTIRELTRAALRDVGKYLTRQCNQKGQQLRGLKRSKRVRGRSSAFQYWNRAKECDLQIGIGNTKQGQSGDTWYGIQQELGTKKQPRRAIITSTVEQNIAKIVEIESQYLSALEDEARSLSLIDEEDNIGSEE